jgi:1-acyl-sn-glycerol-3-phosphate acyltransferase
VLLPLRHGIAHFGGRGRFPVVPAGISGTHELWRGKRITIRVGAPLSLDSEDVLGSVGRLEQAMRALIRSEPEPAGPRPWRWLTHLLR